MDCWTNPPADDGGFDVESLESGVYDCGNRLLDITEDKFRCVAREECKHLKIIMKCVTKEWCTKY